MSPASRVGQGGLGSTSSSQARRSVRVGCCTTARSRRSCGPGLGLPVGVASRGRHLVPHDRHHAGAVCIGCRGGRRRRPSSARGGRDRLGRPELPRQAVEVGQGGRGRDGRPRCRGRRPDRQRRGRRQGLRDPRARQLPSPMALSTRPATRRWRRDLAERFPRLHTIAFTQRGSISASENTWSGVLVDTRRLSTWRRSYRIAPIVDRVGAGDAFAAGLIYAILDGRAPDAALEFAVAASCLKHTIRGDVNAVSVAEVDALARRIRIGAGRAMTHSARLEVLLSIVGTGVLPLFYSDDADRAGRITVSSSRRRGAGDRVHRSRTGRLVRLLDAGRLRRAPRPGCHPGRRIDPRRSCGRSVHRRRRPVHRRPELQRRGRAPVQRAADPVPAGLRHTDRDRDRRGIRRRARQGVPGRLARPGVRPGDPRPASRDPGRGDRWRGGDRGQRQRMDRRRRRLPRLRLCPRQPRPHGTRWREPIRRISRRRSPASSPSSRLRAPAAHPRPDKESRS